MMKMKHKGLLALGLIPSELEYLKQGRPLTIRLDDIGLPGQVIVILMGESNEKLKALAEQAADQLAAMSNPLIDTSKVNFQ